MTEERCVCCGEIIPEGLQVCFNCDPKLEEYISFSKGQCFKCGATRLITMHEPLMGNKYRDLSVKYDLRVPLCWECHEYVQIEPSQEYNKYLQVLMQEKFNRENENLNFLRIFGRNYL